MILGVPVEFLFVLPLLVLVFVAISACVSSLSGCSRLARNYRAERPIDGARFPFASASWRWLMDYNGCLTITVNAEGLHLAIMPFIFFFRVGHPPLFLPWNEMTITREHNRWCGDHVCLRMAKDPDVPIRIRLGLADKLRQAAEREWPETAVIVPLPA